MFGFRKPKSFYIIRVGSKPPCVIIWVAFLGGASGILRHRELTELKACLRDLKVVQQRPWYVKLARSRLASRNSALSEVDEDEACQLLSKPMDKVLIRYQSVPEDSDSILGKNFFARLADRPGESPHHSKKSVTFGSSQSKQQQQPQFSTFKANQGEAQSPYCNNTVTDEPPVFIKAGYS